MQELEHVPSFNLKILVLTTKVFILYPWRHDDWMLEFVVAMLTIATIACEHKGVNKWQFEARIGLEFGVRHNSIGLD